MNTFIISVHIVIKMHYAYPNCIMYSQTEGLWQFLCLYTLLQARELSQVCYKIILNWKLQLRRLTLLDYLELYSYCMEMFRYSVVLVLHNAQSLVDASPGGKIQSTFSRSNTHGIFVWSK